VVVSTDKGGFEPLAAVTSDEAVAVDSSADGLVAEPHPIQQKTSINGTATRRTRSGRRPSPKSSKSSVEIGPRRRCAVLSGCSFRAAVSRIWPGRAASDSHLTGRRACSGDLGARLVHRRCSAKFSAPRSTGPPEQRTEPAICAVPRSGHSPPMSRTEACGHPICHPIYCGTPRDGPGRLRTERPSLGHSETLRDRLGRFGTDS
jgi:hypothetical protein